MKAVLQSPTLHFLILGLITFILYISFQKTGNNSDTTIIVNRDTLLTYLAFRNRRFDDNSVSERLDNMEKEELDRLINNYVREEILFRQTKQLGLDQHDDVIRQRMIQKINFINRGIISDSIKFPDADIQRYYEANRAK